MKTTALGLFWCRMSRTREAESAVPYLTLGVCPWGSGDGNLCSPLYPWGSFCNFRFDKRHTETRKENKQGGVTRSGRQEPLPKVPGQPDIQPLEPFLQSGLWLFVLLLITTFALFFTLSIPCMALELDVPKIRNMCKIPRVFVLFCFSGCTRGCVHVGSLPLCTQVEEGNILSNRQEPAPSSPAGIPACWQRAEQEGAQGPHHACKKLLEASRSCYPHVPAACFQLPPASGCPPSSSHPD